MGFTYDSYGNLVQSRMFLANPQKEYIGELSNPKEVSLTLNKFNLNEITFDIYQFENEEETEFYNQILSKKLIELQYWGWFQIEDAIPVQDDVMQCEVKRVKCLSLENELVDKHIDYISGVYSLYDFADREHSLLHQIVANTNWKIGHVDNDLLGKKRTFDVDNARKYNFLTTDVSKSFECAFIFDTYAKTINAYKLENVGELTDIILHASNVLKNYEQVSSGSDIVTKMRVTGADGVDIRNVNPVATNELINVDYFLKPISEGGWMTDGLVTAFNNYKSAYQGVMETYNTNRNLLRTQLGELTTLKSQLTDLEGLKKAKEEVQGTYVQLHNGTPPFGSQDYVLYLNAVNAIKEYVTQIALKRVEITTKENQVKATRAILDNIGTDLNLSNYLTQDQMDELSVFLTEGEVYQDSTFIITDSMTDEEALDMQIELMTNASNELFRASQPQITTTTTINNLFTMRDDRDSLISIEEWREKFQLGNLISLKFRNDYFSTVRLIQMKINFNNLTDIEVTFSDKNRMDDSLTQLEELLADAGRTSSALSLAKYGYDQASKQTSTIRGFINGTLDTTLNAIQNNDNQEMYQDTYGTRMRKWLPDQNGYDDCQSWWTNNILLFTSDGWKSAKTGIGQFTTPSGEKIQAVIADVICGQLLMGENLAIENESGTYTINNDGFTATNGIYSVGINPNTPSEILNVKVNGENKLYVDTTNNKLVFKGHIEAISGSFQGNITGGTINIGTKFSVDYFGNMNANSATLTNGTFSGSIIAGSIDINSRFKVDPQGLVTINSNGLIVNSNNFTLTSDGKLTCTDANITGTINATSGKIGSATFTGGTVGIHNAMTLNGALVVDYIQLNSGMVVAGGSLSIADGTLYVSGNSTIGGNLTVNGNLNISTINSATPVTSSNFSSYFTNIKNNYTYPPSSHTHGGYATSSELSTLESFVNSIHYRVTQLEMM